MIESGSHPSVVFLSPFLLKKTSSTLATGSSVFIDNRTKFGGYQIMGVLYPDGLAISPKDDRLMKTAAECQE